MREYGGSGSSPISVIVARGIGLAQRFGGDDARPGRCR